MQITKIISVHWTILCCPVETFWGRDFENVYGILFLLERVHVISLSLSRTKNLLKKIFINGYNNYAWVGFLGDFYCN